MEKRIRASGCSMALRMQQDGAVSLIIIIPTGCSMFPLASFQLDAVGKY